MNKPDSVICGDCKKTRLEIWVEPRLATQEYSYNQKAPFWKWECTCGWTRWMPVKVE